MAVTWANSATNDGPDNWTDAPNATGVPDGTVASLAGQLLASTDATLRLGFATGFGGNLQLRFHTRLTNTDPLVTSTLTHLWRIGGGDWQELASYSSADFLAEPDVHEIVTAPGTIELGVRVQFPSAASTESAEVDAVGIDQIGGGRARPFTSLVRQAKPRHITARLRSSLTVVATVRTFIPAVEVVQPRTSAQVSLTARAQAGMTVEPSTRVSLAAAGGTHVSHRSTATADVRVEAATTRAALTRARDEADLLALLPLISKESHA